MGPLTDVWIDVTEESAVGAVRRAAVDRAAAAGLPEQRVAEVAIVAAELAANVHRHAGSGTILVRRGAGHVEIVAVDSGPGFEAPPVEGLSSRGGLGIGLGAIRRLSDWSDVYSRPGSGTVFAVRIGEAGPLDVAGLTRPMPGETTGGDAYSWRTDDETVTLLVCDGLGHGPLAASAAGAAVRAFEDAPAGPPAQLVKHVHGEISHTRGVAVAVAQARGGTLTFAGLGNIAATLVHQGEHRGLISLPGIAGHRAAAIRQYDYPLSPGALIVMHTDGLRQRWSFGDYPGLVTRRPLVIAGTLLRDLGVRRDDAGVLVARMPS
ncbi:SpoIIE family protein phosphatase [Herbidospora sp. NEAU-GS84]|uniref:SpoIIE family protein phosphatase n=1 Tax=Herbidospora solisilvae TaxID=2696284 RepID=A0A7C9J710_9ACTN|nr:ATP-binding protein [Herbidospora solisilvae]NAS21288.1 SpoIIE family protein phosphatase [Herbidospora solisilvae]